MQNELFTQPRTETTTNQIQNHQTMKKYALFLCLLWACHTKIQTDKVYTLFDSFPAYTLTTDTLKYFANQDGFGVDPSQGTTPLSDTLLATHLEPALLERLSFTGSGEYFAGQRIALDESRTGCIIYTKDNWFKKTSLLIFDHKQQQFKEVVDLAQYYGGESGLDNRVSWLYKSPNALSLFSRNNVTYFKNITDEETTGQPEVKDDLDSEQNALYAWDVANGKFVPEVLQDSVAVCATFRHVVED
jgi:hypothetical protein